MDRGPGSPILAKPRIQRVVTLGLVLFVMLGYLGCSPPPPNDPSTLVVALESAPRRFDPRLATDQSSARLMELLLDGLVTEQPNGNLVPSLAEKWEVLDDGRRWRFHLRSGVTFHDGRPFRAEDVVWTFGTLLDGTVVSPKKGALSSLVAVHKVEAFVVDFLLEEPSSSLLYNLTPALGIIPEGTTPEDQQRHPIGTGPFLWLRGAGEDLSLGANPAYWAGPVSLSKLRLREIPDATVRALELQKGSVHLVINGLAPDVVPSFREDDRFRVVESAGSNFSYVGIQHDHPQLKDPRLRRALALAINRPLIARTLWRDLFEPTESLLPPHHWAFNTHLDPLPYDPEESMRLLDEIGYRDPDGEGPESRLQLTLKTSTNEPYLLQAQAIQAMMTKVGVDLEIRSHEFATFYNDIKRGHFELFSLIWTGINDPDIFRYTLHSNRMPPDGANRGRYRNESFDRLVEQAGASFDREERRQLYGEIQAIFLEDLPYIPLFTRRNVAVLAKSVEGYENYSSGQFYGIWKLGLKEDP